MIKQIKMFARFNIYRNIWYSCLAIMLVAFVSSCVEDDELPKQVETRAMATTRVAIADNANIKTARVLIFGTDRNRVYIGDKINIAESQIEGQILTIRNSTPIQVNVGTNHVYVVLNEETGNFTDDTFNAITTVDAMEVLRETPIEYTDIIAVTDGEEPVFLMCVYDEVEIASNSSAEPLVLDLTGSQENNGFSMRRPMAKVVLESVIGGVSPDGTIVGTTTTWNGNVSEDQISDDTDNKDLIATSAVHILGVELINVPNQFYWNHDGSDPTTQSPYDVTYHTDAIPIATSDFNLTEKYFDREWPGVINGTGEVEFTRTDAMYSMWKKQQNSGLKAYIVYDPEDVKEYPDDYYYWGISGGSIPMPSTGITCEIPYADAMKIASNFSHYTIDENGIIHLFDTSGREFDAPNNSMYTLNKGNFITFFQENYGNMSGNFVPGRPIAGAMKTTPYIDPSVWNLKFNNVSYYIPENITNNSDNYTKLRITASVAIPTVELDPDEVNKAINAQGGSGELVGEEGKIDMSDKNIINYLYAKGEMLPHPTKEGYYALAYAGLKRMYKGTVTVSNAKGRYEKMSGFDAQVVTFEIPLNNDEIEGGTDVNQNHNIYRGHEYRVKLYVTKSSKEWGRSANPASRTINIGGEELTITGKVTASPIK